MAASPLWQLIGRNRGAAQAPALPGFSLDSQEDNWRERLEYAALLQREEEERKQERLREQAEMVKLAVDEMVTSQVDELERLKSRPGMSEQDIDKLTAMQVEVRTNGALAKAGKDEGFIGIRNAQAAVRSLLDANEEQEIKAAALEAQLKADLGKQNFDRFKELNDNLAAEAKPFLEQRAAYAQIKDLYSREPNIHSDLALIFRLYKLLDPQSVVRESEFAQMQNLQGLPDIVVQMLNRFRDGRLTTQDRAAMLEVAEGAWAAARTEQGLRQERIMAQARAFEIPERYVQRLPYQLNVAEPGQPAIVGTAANGEPLLAFPNDPVIYDANGIGRGLRSANIVGTTSNGEPIYLASGGKTLLDGNGVPIPADDPTVPGTLLETFARGAKDTSWDETGLAVAGFKSGQVRPSAQQQMAEIAARTRDEADALSRQAETLRTQGREAARAASNEQAIKEMIYGPGEVPPNAAADVRDLELTAQESHAQARDIESQQKRLDARAASAETRAATLDARGLGASVAETASRYAPKVARGLTGLATDVALEGAIETLPPAPQEAARAVKNIADAAGFGSMGGPYGSAAFGAAAAVYELGGRGLRDLRTARRPGESWFDYNRRLRAEREARFQLMRQRTNGD